MTANGGVPAPRAVDIHAHHVPAALLKLAGREGDQHGIAVSQGDGGRWTIQLGSGPPRVVPPPLVDGERYRSQMETQQLGTRILSGWNETFAYELEPDAAAWWCAAQNDTLGEVVGIGDAALAGLAVVPLQDANLAAAELRRAVAERGLRGALIGTHVRGANLDAEKLHPFWEAACEQDVPVVVHPGSASLDRERLSSYFMANTVGNPAETTIAAASLIFGGVLARFPELKIVLVHGGGFFPYQLGRLWKAFNVRDEVPKGDDHDPLAAAHRFYYDTILHYAPALNQLIEVAGPERLLFGTDFPFEMAEHRPPAEWLGDALPDGAAFNAVAAGNAQQLFGLPLER